MQYYSQNEKLNKFKDLKYYDTGYCAKKAVYAQGILFRNQSVYSQGMMATMLLTEMVLRRLCTHMVWW